MVIPVYNQADYVLAAVDSVLEQDYPSIDLTVVDDGSTDATPRLLAERSGEFRVLTQVNRGAAAALNRGIQESSGEFVCWLSADDLFLPEKVTRQVEAFGDEPDLGLVYTGFEQIRANGQSIIRVAAPVPVHPDPFVMVFWRNSINGSSVMVRREVFDVCGPFDESLRADVDGDMWLRLTQRYRVRRIDGVYLKYRVHDRALSANRPLMIASLTEVRRRYLRSGVLQDRLATAGEKHAARLMSWMAAEFAERGLDELGREMLGEARQVGHEPAAGALAGWTIGLSALARRSRPWAIVTRPLRSALRRLRATVAARS